MINSADPDQLASSEANWSGFTLFAKQGMSGFSRTRVNTQNDNSPNIFGLYCLTVAKAGASFKTLPTTMKPLPTTFPQ